MTEKQVQGILREAFTLIGGVVASFGFANEHLLGVIIGFATQAAMLVWAIRTKQGSEILRTILRKAIQAAAPLAVALKWIDAAQSTAILHLATFGVSTIWSAIDNGGGKPPGRLPIIVLALLMAGCAQTNLRFTEDNCVLVGRAVQVRGIAGDVYIGTCDDGRHIAEWDQFDLQGQPVTVRATRFPSGKIGVQYKTEQGLVDWSSKSGISIVAFPQGFSP